MHRLLLLVLVLVLACEDDRHSAPPSPPPQPVPPPAGLAAELSIPAPGAFLANARDATGDAAFLPGTLGGLVANLLGLPIRVAEHVEEQLPLVGAAATRGAELDLAVAVRVRHGDRFVDQATRGEEGSFTAQRDGELVWLAPNKKARAARIAATLAVIDDCLVVGSSNEAIRLLAPYLARTLAPRPPGKTARIELRPGALAALTQQLRTPELPPSWRALVDPEDIVRAVRDVAADIGAGEATIDLGKQALTVDAHFDAKNEKAQQHFAAWPTVPTAALLQVPEDVVASAVWGEGEQARIEHAKARSQATAKLLDSPSSLSTLLEALARARGDDARIGLRCTGVGLTGFATGGVTDAKTLNKSLKGVFELAEAPPVVARLEREGLRLETKKTRIEHVPMDLWRLRLLPKEATKSDTEKPKREPIDLLGGADERTFLVAAGMETIDTLQRLHQADPERALAKQSAMRGAAERLSDRVWLGLLADPLALQACLQGAPAGDFATPITLAAEPVGKRVRLRLEVARPLLRLVGAAL